MNELKTCPNCNSFLKPVYKLKYNILECSSCKLQIAEDARFNFSMDSLLNENVREAALKKIRVNNFSRIIEYILAYFPDKQIRGLEIGCSYGWFLDLCTKNKINCIGIEPETRFNDYYIEKGHQVINGFYPAALDEKEKFDFIIFNDVLEHIPDINNVIIANYRFLKTEGMVIVNIPIQSGLFYRIAVLCYHIGIKLFLNRMWQFDFHSPHLYYFTKKNLKNIFRGKGFECLEIKPMQVIDASQMKNRIAEDQSVGKAKLWLITFCSYLITPFTKVKPDIFCFFFKKH